MTPGLDRAVEAFHAAMTIFFIIAMTGALGFLFILLLMWAPVYIGGVLGGFALIWGLTYLVFWNSDRRAEARQAAWAARR